MSGQTLNRRRYLGQYVGIAIGAVGLFFAIGYAIYAQLSSLWGHLFWTGVVVVPVYLVAVWLIRRRPDHPQARRLLLMAAASCVGVGLESVCRSLYTGGPPPDWLWIANLGHQYTTAVTAVASGILLASYPDGVVEQRWQRRILWLVWAQLAVPPLLLISRPQLIISPYFLDPAPPDPVASPFAVPALDGVGGPLELIFVSYLTSLIGVVVLLVRFAQADQEQRRPMRLLVYSMAAAVPLLLIIAVLTVLGVPPDSAVFQVLGVFFIPLAVMVPVSIVVGVLRHRLFDIDLVLRRSMVYGVLVVAVAAIYIALAAAPGLALGNQIPVQLAVILTVLAALAFAPLRRRLEALADRWVFGRRINRYQLLTSFGATLEQSLDLADLLPRLAQAVRSGLRSSWVRVSLRGEELDEWLAEPLGLAGEVDADVALVEELRHDGEVVGRIECGSAEASYADADRELLATLARQAATAIANVRLAAQLREQLAEVARSRARIVAAQDTERRRIERDIHDGVQQEVVALLTKVRLARNRLGRGETPEPLLTEMQSDIGELLVDLRDLAHGIHPPVLTDGGLVAAVEARAGRLPLAVSVQADAALRSRRLDPEVEAAAYFLVCEALTNAVKHSGAEQVRIDLSAPDGVLALAIRDDGSGLGTVGARVLENGVQGHGGQGLTNLRDRIEALGGHFEIAGAAGGGTLVSAELPVGGRHG